MGIGESQKGSIMCKIVTKNKFSKYTCGVGRDEKSPLAFQKLTTAWTRRGFENDGDAVLVPGMYFRIARFPFILKAVRIVLASRILPSGCVRKDTDLSIIDCD